MRASHESRFYKILCSRNANNGEVCVKARSTMRIKQRRIINRMENNGDIDPRFSVASVPAGRWCKCTTPGFTFTLSTFKYLWTNKFATASAEIPRRESIFRKISEKLSLLFVRATVSQFERVRTLIQRNFTSDTVFRSVLKFMIIQGCQE